MRLTRMGVGHKPVRRVLPLTVLLGVALQAPGMTGAAEDVVRLGDIPVISNAAIYIAIEKGFFQEEGIRNEATTFASGAKMTPALASGEIDVAVGTPSAGLFNAILQGAPYRIVADKGQARAGTPFFLLMVRKDLVTSGDVKTVRDLRGKKVGVFAKGTNHAYLLGKMAEEVGLTIADLDLVYLAAPNQLTALQTKAIDAAIAVEPWVTRFEEQGMAVRFRTPDQVKGLGPVQAAVVIYSGTFIKERRALAQRWMNAYLRGAKFFAANGVQHPDIPAILEKYTKVPAKTVRAAVPHYQAPDGRPHLEGLADMTEFFAANGYMQQRIAVERVVDLSFLR